MEHLATKESYFHDGETFQTCPETQLADASVALWLLDAGHHFYHINLKSGLCCPQVDKKSVQIQIIF